MLTLKTHFQLQDADPEQGHFKGLASVFGSLIQAWVPTIIQPGAFTKTLAERQRRIKLLWQHDDHEPIGLPVELTETSQGLEVTGRLSMTQRGRDALILLRDGVLDALSIGFDAIVEELQKDTQGNVTRFLKEIKLWEISLVTWGADPQATILDVYSAQPYQDLPLAPPAYVWDPEAAEARVRAWAQASERPNDRYRRAFAWIDRSNPEAFEAHRLPLADIVDGQLAIVPAALEVAQACLPALPPADRQAIAETLQRYRAKATHAVDETVQHLATWAGRLAALRPGGLSAAQQRSLEATIASLQPYLPAAAPLPPPEAQGEPARTAARVDQLRTAELWYADYLAR